MIKYSKTKKLFLLNLLKKELKRLIKNEFNGCFFMCFYIAEIEDIRIHKYDLMESIPELWKYRPERMGNCYDKKMAWCYGNTVTDRETLILKLESVEKTIKDIKNNIN